MGPYQGARTASLILCLLPAHFERTDKGFVLRIRLARPPYETDGGAQVASYKFDDGWKCDAIFRVFIFSGWGLCEF